MGILDAHIANVVVHRNATCAGTIFPFKIHAHVLSSRLILRDIVVILEDGYKMLGVLFAHVFDSRVVDDETKQDGLPFVVPEAWRCGYLVIQLGLDVIISIYSPQLEPRLLTEDVTKTVISILL